MKKMMKNTLTLAAVAGAGYGAWLAYKRYNPNALDDLKNNINHAKLIAKKDIENMM